MPRAVRFIAAIAAILVAAPSMSAAQDTPPVPLFMYMVDVTNSNVGCPRCFHDIRTDNVMPGIVDRIVAEVRAQPKPVDVLVVPYARGIVDFDADGPFDPWRVFAIRDDADAGRLAAYLDPPRFAPPPEAGKLSSAEWLPAYSPRQTELVPWPGLEKAAAERDFFTSASYEAIVEGLNYLRNRVPGDPEKRAAYLEKRIHKLMALTDSRNHVRSALFAHLVQGVELHRSEMEGRFWLTKVYAEGKLPDNEVEEEFRSERKIAQTADGLGVYKLKDLPPVESMLVPSSLAIEVNVGAAALKGLIGESIPLDLSGFSIHGDAASIEASMEPTRINDWPAGAGIAADDATFTPPFAGAGAKLSPTLTGLRTLIEKDVKRLSARVHLTAAGAGAPPALFLASGSPELVIYLHVDLNPPTGRIDVTVQAPDAGDDGVYDLGEWPLRKVKDDAIPPVTIAVAGDEFVIEPAIRVEFDINTVRIDGPDGPVSAGGAANPGTYIVHFLPPDEPRVVDTAIDLVSEKPMHVFAGDAARRRLQFRYTAVSDLPFYLIILGAILAIAAAAAVVLRKTVFKPPRIGDIGGTLVMTRGLAGQNERDLSTVEGSAFTVGSGPECDWRLEGEYVPHVAFVIERRRGEDRLRVHKRDSEVENVRLNEREMVESFLKNGDRIELPDFSFEFRRDSAG
ncbi:hypothetical protein K8I61_05800 [bacterium]|nr:hypothetical protein [bacterium]